MTKMIEYYLKDMDTKGKKVLDIGIAGDPVFVRQEGDVPKRGGHWRFVKDSDYASMDNVESYGPDIVADVENMWVIKDNTVDLVFAISLLEHVPNFFRANYEILRILKYGGILLLAVPKEERYHPEKHFPDLWRFLPSGVGYLLKDYEEVKITEGEGVIFAYAKK